MALSYRPEPWRPADSIVWGRLIAWELFTNFADESLRELHVRPSLTPGDAMDFPTAQRLSQREDLRGFPTSGASNNSAIAGRPTATGKPLLANDPHLGLGLQHLAISPARVRWTGAGRGDGAGFPIIVIGRNDHVAWGFTTAYADTQDLFVETLLDDGQYATPDAPAPSSVGRR